MQLSTISSEKRRLGIWTREMETRTGCHVNFSKCPQEVRRRWLKTRQRGPPAPLHFLPFFHWGCDHLQARKNHWFGMSQ